MRKFCLLVFLAISIAAADFGEFEKLFAALPDSFGMLVAVDDYKSLRSNKFRYAIVEPIISGTPGEFSKKTRQANKLSAKIDALQYAAGFRFIGENLEPLIGEKSAVAFYYVGDLEFVYATTMPHFPQSLEKPRSWYEKHERGGITYWTAQKDRQGAFGAFFYHNGILLITNSKRQLERALALAAGESKKSIAADKTTLSAAEISGFTGDEDALVVLNMALLRDDPYYARYYQGAPAESKKLLRTAFSFRFDGKTAKIVRVSLPDGDPGKVEQFIPGKFADILPENVFAYREIAVSAPEDIPRLIPFGEFLPTGDKTPSIEYAAEAWFAPAGESPQSPVVPIVYIRPYDTRRFVKELKDTLPKHFEDTLVPGYGAHWERRGEFHTLVDNAGISLGFAYTVRKSAVILTTAPEMVELSRLGRDGEIASAAPKRETVSFAYFRPEKVGKTLAEHIDYLMDKNYLISYTATSFWENFGEPIAKNVLPNIEKIERHDYFDETAKIWRTETKVELK